MQLEGFSSSLSPR
jgi:hypothetical protein